MGEYIEINGSIKDRCLGEPASDPLQSSGVYTLFGHVQHCPNRLLKVKFGE